MKVKMRAEVHILVNFPIDTSPKKKTHSALCTSRNFSDILICNEALCSPFCQIYLSATQPACQAWAGVSSNQGAAVGQICNETVNICAPMKCKDVNSQPSQWNGQHLTIKMSTVSPGFDQIKIIDQSSFKNKQKVL